jgi:hypothetical protein
MRIRVEPESAATKPDRATEAVVVPENAVISGGREGPLLQSRVQSEARRPDCPRKGRLNPGGSPKG